MEQVKSRKKVVGQIIIRDKWGHFMKGTMANRSGRPKGSTSLKTMAQAFLKELSHDEKLMFLRMIDPMDVWRMAEGNPHSTEDQTVKHIIPTPIVDLKNAPSLPANSDTKESIVSSETPKIINASQINGVDKPLNS